MGETSTHFLVSSCQKPVPGRAFRQLFLRKGKEMAVSLSVEDSCPMELGLRVLSGRWRLRIAWQLWRSGPLRFNEMQRRVGEISARTLSRELQDLESLGIIRRNVWPGKPPAVEYFLTDQGRGISAVFSALCDFGKSLQSAAGKKASPEGPGEGVIGAHNDFNAVREETSPQSPGEERC